MENQHPNPDPLRQGWHSRGYLPHLKVEGGTYFVTFRLADSLPQDLQERFQEQLRSLGAEAGTAMTERAETVRTEQRREIERSLDRNLGACYLRRPAIARVVVDALRHFDGKRYLLHEWVVMPNHAHALLTPNPPHRLGDIVKTWKQFSALRANRLLGCVGKRFWQPESFDRWVRDDAERVRIVRYVRENPVKAGLCLAASDWPWSSAAQPERLPS